jgi:hypothetical protein
VHDCADKQNPMTTTPNSSSALTINQAPASTPVIGDDYVLVRRSQVQTPTKEKKGDEKKSNNFAFGLGKTPFSSAGGRFGACKAILTFDFSFTPSTSSTLQTVVALSPSSDNSFSSYWSKLFSTMRMDKAEVLFDMTEFINPVGHDFAMSPVVVGYTPNASAATQYYADVSDYKTAVFAGYSTAKPVVRYAVPSKWIQGWVASQEASAVYTYTPKWGSTQVTGGTVLNSGYVHFASQKAMFDVERNIVGRLRMWMTFKGQL